eukprot:scaffold1810_cov60-Cyclotella_meneghiniana.AAC.15
MYCMCDGNVAELGVKVSKDHLRSSHGQHRADEWSIAMVSRHPDEPPPLWRAEWVPLKFCFA